jgi:type II restriction/modification system DNA methylase subunit YeeA
MNKANLKTYAPKARLDFIAAVTARANLLGITSRGSSPVEQRGDIAIIEGREWPAAISMQRDKLITGIMSHGFDHFIDEVAYTWFNRFAALRFMEIHDYLDHGWRVLSSRDGGLPEILSHATDVSLPGLDRERIVEMQLAGTRSDELYRILMVAQCNDLSRSMPFLFERIDDETELLLPDNLLRTDSIVSKLVSSIPEGDWTEIEIVGWLYQFYISERKEAVIGKAARSEDIPAATQLFTPNWIVQYLVQNSVGRLWLKSNPSSVLASQWPYYVESAEQSPQILTQLQALIDSRTQQDGDTINPESITVLDPACGSGHILVVAYDVLKAIYLERGYRLRDIPHLILKHNLFGLDIDDRAAQLAGFALLMKARADDRRILNSPAIDGTVRTPKINVLSLQESKGLDVDELFANLAPFDLSRATIADLVEIFVNAKTYGSLIRISPQLAAELTVVLAGLVRASESGDMYAKASAEDLLPLARQAQIIALRFDAVVANPPYMGRKGMPVDLQAFVDGQMPLSRADLYACFIEVARVYAKDGGAIALITMDSWMYGEEYKEMRAEVLDETTIVSLAHLGPHAFPEIPGEVVQTAAVALLNVHCENYASSYFDLRAFKSSGEKADVLRGQQNRYINSAELYNFLPRRVVAYYAGASTLRAFQNSEPLMGFAEALTGLQTGDNPRFLRYWFEVSTADIRFGCRSIVDAKSSASKWFPYIKGSEFRKWYGSQLYVVNWQNDGAEIRQHASSTVRNAHKYFAEGIAYNNIAKNFCVRDVENGFVFDQKNSMFFASRPEYKYSTMGYLQSKVVKPLLEVVAPKDFNPGSLKILPAIRSSFESDRATEVVRELIALSRSDWDSLELSWDFARNPLASHAPEVQLISESFERVASGRDQAIAQAKILEEENNSIFISAYSLQDELTPDVPEDLITLIRADCVKDAQRLISYAIGCMMGRYSLDEPGLIYALSGNSEFDPSRYASFPADADGIVPVTDELWFPDDASIRIREFLRVTWGPGKVDENMAWLADSLGARASETPDEAVRRYVSDKFYKDHLQAYKKRPIYWQFSSGKLGAFKALVYLHRYSPSTLSRMRSEYVVPLTSKFSHRMDMLEKDYDASTSTAERSKMQKQIEALRKKQAELTVFEERLRHFADMRIDIDLDDGVKLNYAKFGELVSESKFITGGGDE